MDPLSRRQHHQRSTVNQLQRRHPAAVEASLPAMQNAQSGVEGTASVFFGI